MALYSSLRARDEKRKLKEKKCKKNADVDAATIGRIINGSVGYFLQAFEDGEKTDRV